MMMIMRKETRDVMKDILAIRGRGLACVLKSAVTTLTSSYVRTTCQGSIELLKISPSITVKVSFLDEDRSMGKREGRKREGEDRDGEGNG